MGLRKMEVAIASCYFMSNYGSLLQTYALQKGIEDFGYEVENICIDGIKKEIENRKIKYYIKVAKDFSVILNKAGRIKKSIFRKINKKYACLLKKRADKTDLFRRKYIKISELLPDWESLTAYTNQCSAVIVGSDQLWLPSNIVADYYTLSFVPDNISKIAFATSFGISKFPDSMNKQTKLFLDRFQKVSVRETTGQEIFKNITGRECSLVCDPTMLLSKEEWLKAIPPKSIVKGGYIFCYFLGKIKRHREIAVELKKRTGLKIVALLHCEQYVSNDDGYADETPFDVGPDDFVNLIRNASYVLTDSFHGTVFSIINQKIFFTFTRHSDTEKLSTNSRIYNLADIFGIRNRVLAGNENVEEILNRNMDLDDISEKLTVFREMSKKYLYEALEK